LLQNYGFSFALRKAKKAFFSKTPNQLSEAVKITKNTTTVKTRNLLGKVQTKPSFFPLL
jgi:hypothetical protein